ncbi:MAG: hypothetical protein H6722_24810 [Sandaracinus sp.]|nr:hypothetical protein [Sandaracinus sp.]MCB9615665.1 hypothetical protein [Sandaracinus sp.]MCB9618755.1 hypothetical protein [Sandaracinus sp.]
MTTVRIGGGEGDFLGYAKNVVELVSPVPFAPGQPGRFELGLEAGALALEGRSLGSRKRDDGRFVVRFRLISLRRDEREALEALGG